MAYASAGQHATSYADVNNYVHHSHPITVHGHGHQEHGHQGHGHHGSHVDYFVRMILRLFDNKIYKELILGTC